jgi:sporulation protein YlmC with PRC-barrel domain
MGCLGIRVGVCVLKLKTLKTFAKERMKMKMINTILTAGALTLAASLQAQTYHATKPLDQTSATTSDQQNIVSKANKASDLIGMDVRNQQNEKLGDIKDLVVDLPSGKISYAVLSVGGFLGIGDKLIAVPTRAFAVAPTQDALVLNADKAKIQNAPSFAKSSWPEVNSPAWRTESAYWLSGDTAQGTIGSSYSGTGAEHLTARAKDSFHGSITAISPENGTMTVQGPSGTREFKLSSHPILTLKGKDNLNPRLDDFKVGEPVVVRFHQANGSYLADSVMQSDASEVK